VPAIAPITAQAMIATISGDPSRRDDLMHLDLLRVHHSEQRDEDDGHSGDQETRPSTASTRRAVRPRVSTTGRGFGAFARCLFAEPDRFSGLDLALPLVDRCGSDASNARR